MLCIANASYSTGACCEQVEEGTPFERWQSEGKLSLPQEDDGASMLCAASETLRAAGFEHYEVSNYARPGHRCRHNMVYWLGESYYAFGVGAASFLQGRRFARPKGLKAWRAYVDSIADAARGTLQRPDFVAGAAEPELEQQDRMLEGLMLQLRLADGVDIERFGHEFGSANRERLLDAVQPHVDAGLASIESSIVVDAASSEGRREPSVHAPGVHGPGDEGAPHAAEGLRLRLSDPRGLMLSNQVISDLFVALTDA